MFLDEFRENLVLSLELLLKPRDLAILGVAGKAPVG
jgi:hypothetical protein